MKGLPTGSPFFLSDYRLSQLYVCILPYALTPIQQHFHHSRVTLPKFKSMNVAFSCWCTQEYVYIWEVKTGETTTRSIMQKPDISFQIGMISMEKGMKSWTYKRVVCNYGAKDQVNSQIFLVNSEFRIRK
jgi:hypothetical protein